MPEPDIRATVERLMISAGLIVRGEAVTLAPLAGGVSCEAWRATTARGDYAVKVALPQLRVRTEWFAPVERAATEARWFELVAGIAPLAVPRLVAAMPADHALITAFLPPEQAPVWKQEMIDGRVDTAFAAAVGGTLAEIHLKTERQESVARAFADHAAFHALRIEPFLLYTAKQHPEVGETLRRLAEGLGASRVALVHGDVSPKNILVSNLGPVFLDAECAVYGDPAFDVAFCTTHLLLKAAWLEPHRARLIESARQLVTSYGTHVGPTRMTGLDQRLTLLIPALLLARIDGRSPAEYIKSDTLKTVVRDAAIAMLHHPLPDVAALIGDWMETLG